MYKKYYYRARAKKREREIGKKNIKPKRTRRVGIHADNDVVVNGTEEYNIWEQ